MRARLTAMAVPFRVWRSWGRPPVSAVADLQPAGLVVGGVGGAGYLP
jgi:hypothetical protein